MERELNPALLPNQEICFEAGCFGLLMVKPHALREGLAAAIISIFEGDISPIFQRNICGFRNELARVTVCGQYYRNLATAKYYDELIHLFYGNEKNERYFPMLYEYYRGDAAFLLLKYQGTYEQLIDFLVRIKGVPEQYDNNGGRVTESRGIRGALSTSQIKYARTVSSLFRDEEYRRIFNPVIQNYIHSCDSREETAATLRYILSKTDIEDLEDRGYKIGEFAAGHAPRPHLLRAVLPRLIKWHSKAISELDHSWPIGVHFAKGQDPLIARNQLAHRPHLLYPSLPDRRSAQKLRQDA